MSWQQYIDNSLLGTHAVTHAAIIGLENGDTWATSPGFTVSPVEGKNLVKAFVNPMDLYSSGLTVAGTRYIFIKNTETALYGRKGSTSGVCITKTGKCLIIGSYAEGIQPGSCNLVVEKLGDYLRSSGY